MSYLNYNYNNSGTYRNATSSYSGDFVQYLTDEDPRAKQPKKITTELKMHQLTALKKMQDLEKTKLIKYKLRDGLSDFSQTFHNDEKTSVVRTNVSILGDSAGFGKTLTILSLIASMDKPPEDKPHTIYNFEGNRNIMRRFVNAVHRKVTNVSLVVIPNNIEKQWESEIRKHSKLKFITFKGKQTVSLLEKFKYIENNSVHVILCRATIYKQLQEYVNRQGIIWKRVIIDEIDSINAKMYDEIKTLFTWVVSATYQELIGHYYRARHSYVKNLFSDLSSDELIFQALVVQSDPKYLEKSFQMAATQKRYIECITPRVVGAFQTVFGANSDFMSAVNSGDIDKAVEILGGDVKSNRNLIELYTHKIDTQISDLKARRTYTQNLSSVKPEDKKERIDKINEKISKLEKDLERFNVFINGVGDDPCSICFCPMENPVMVTCCSRIYCGECLFLWMARSQACPMCKHEPLEKDHIIYIKSEADGDASVTADEPTEPQAGPSTGLPIAKPDTDTKEKTLLKITKEILKESKDNKILVVSKNDGTRDLIEQVLRGETTIKFASLTTDNRHNVKTIEKYHSGEVNTLFLNSKCNGAGLNLEDTTDIVIYHQMDRALEEQSIARAQRMSRKKDLDLRVYYLRYDHEYED
uniref:RING-type domain-containing protein n=1 Tax=viral metagenome TaxID=1070528 RepID=A0A6C0CKE3_9ZZZZ